MYQLLMIEMAILDDNNNGGDKSDIDEGQGK